MSPFRAICFATFFVLLAACDGGYPSGSTPGGGGAGGEGGGGAGGTGGVGPRECRFEPCGGDLVGTWNAFETCAGGAGLEEYPGCDDAIVHGDPDYSGTITFWIDGTYARDTTVSGDVRYEYDDDCVADLTEGAMNARTYCVLMQDLLGESPEVSGRCDYADGTCACDLTLHVRDSSSGSYQTRGTTLSLDWTDQSYCATDGELRIDAGDGTIATYRR